MRVPLIQLSLAAAACGVARAAADDDIPEAFDTRSKWFGCGLNVVDQGQCGSCWAASATSVFGDRACVWLGESGEALPNGGFSDGNRMFQKAGQCVADLHQEHDHGCKRVAQFASAQALLSCASFAADPKLFPDSAGCAGGWSLDAWRYIFLHGLPTMVADGSGGCAPYTSGHCHGKDLQGNGCKPCAAVVEQCEDNGQPPHFYRVKSFGVIHDPELRPRNSSSEPRPESDRAALDRQVRAMQTEMLANGPVQACIDYYSNFGRFFNDYPLGVYNSTEKHPLTGGHCLNLIGWGYDAPRKMPYWLVKNSWGPGWGNQGVFRFLRGGDLAGIESDVYAGCPANSRCELTAGVIRKDTEFSPQVLAALRPESGAVVQGPLGAIQLPSAAAALRGGDLTAGADAAAPLLTPAAEVGTGTARGGYWVDMTREAYGAPAFAVHVARAYEDVFGRPTTPEHAVAAAERVQAQGGVQGFRLSVKFRDAEAEAVHHHAADGSVRRLNF